MNRRFALVTIALTGTIAFFTGFNVAGSLQPPPTVAVVSARVQVGRRPAARRTAFRPASSTSQTSPSA